MSLFNHTYLKSSVRPLWLKTVQFSKICHCHFWGPSIFIPWTTLCLNALWIHFNMKKYSMIMVIILDFDIKLLRTAFRSSSVFWTLMPKDRGWPYPLNSEPVIPWFIQRMLPQWYTALLYDKKKCMHSDEILKFFQFSKITKIFRLQIRTRIHYFMFGFNCVHGHWSLQFLQGE